MKAYHSNGSYGPPARKSLARPPLLISRLYHTPFIFKI